MKNKGLFVMILERVTAPNSLDVNRVTGPRLTLHLCGVEQP